MIRAFAVGVGLLMCVTLADVRGQTARRSDLSAGRSSLERTYDQGPLVASEFRGRPPDRRPNARRVAYTMTELRYRYRYRFQMQDGRTRMSLKSIEVYTVFLPRKSWNTDPRNKALLRHEQGHFDITYTAELEAGIALAKLGGPPAIEASGTSKQAVLKELSQKTTAWVQGFGGKAEKEQAAYDKETSNGTNGSKQRQYEARLKARIRSLQRELKMREKSKAGAGGRSSSRSR